jgi:hypothetical protein
MFLFNVEHHHPILTPGRHRSKITYSRTESGDGQDDDFPYPQRFRQPPQVGPLDVILYSQVSQDRIRPYSWSGPFHHTDRSTRFRFIRETR